MSKLVSVIIPVWNGEKYISESINSVLNQTYSNIEIIVINDGSTDDTLSVLNNYGNKIICINQVKSGPSTARNAGLKIATGEFIAFQDADDIWLPNKLEIQMQVLNENPDVSLVYGKMVNFESSSGNDLDVQPSDVYSGKLFDKLLLYNLIPLPSVVIRSNIISVVGGFDESLYTAEDTNLWLRIAHVTKIIGVSEVLLRRRIHGENLSKSLCIHVGTLKNLDQIVACFPKYAPENYYPMKMAYMLRGTNLIKELMYYSDYKKANLTCYKLARMKIIDKYIINTYLLTLLPSFILNIVKKYKQLITNFSHIW